MTAQCTSPVKGHLPGSVRKLHCPVHGIRQARGGVVGAASNFLPTLSMKPRDEETNLPINRNGAALPAHHNKGLDLVSVRFEDSKWDGTVFDECELRSGFHAESPVLVLGGTMEGRIGVNNGEVVGLSSHIPGNHFLTAMNQLSIQNTTINGSVLDGLDVQQGCVVSGTRMRHLSTPSHEDLMRYGSESLDLPRIESAVVSQEARLSNCVIGEMEAMHVRLHDNVRVEKEVRAESILIDALGTLPAESFARIKAGSWSANSIPKKTLKDLAQYEDQAWVISYRGSQSDSTRNVLLLHGVNLENEVIQQRCELARSLMIRDDELRVDGRNAEAWEYVFESMDEDGSVDDSVIAVALAMHNNPED